ncbi:hypothetical protein TNCV_936601 [Trichonephila clavipes]|nr:hypothetical protein TNCV_936601 [Trichonephila clavipes]
MVNYKANNKRCIEISTIAVTAVVYVKFMEWIQMVTVHVVNGFGNLVMVTKAAKIRHSVETLNRRGVGEEAFEQIIIPY